jgi:hypothetical protein
MTLEETVGLRKIRLKRLRVWLWMASFLPVLWIAGSTIHWGGAAIAIYLGWVIGYFGSVACLIRSHCPRCGKLFLSAGESPTVKNLLANKCMHCGLPLKAERVMYPSLE